MHNPPSPTLYYRPTIIRKQQAAALRLLNDDVMHSGCLGVVFDETTDCCDRHLVNIIVHTRERVCYATTAFIGRNEAVNSLAIAKAVMDAWEHPGLPRDRVGVVLVDNAGYCARAFKDHLVAFFGNARLRTCWAHCANRFGVAMLEHKGLANMRSKYLHAEYQWPKQEAEDHKKKRVNETDENGEVVQLPTVLQNAPDVLEKKLSLTFYADMGDPIYNFSGCVP